MKNLNIAILGLVLVLARPLRAQTLPLHQFQTLCTSLELVAEDLQVLEQAPSNAEVTEHIKDLKKVRALAPIIHDEFPFEPLYVLAYKHEWKKVSLKTQLFVEHCKKGSSSKNCLSELEDIKNFVLQNNLDPMKTQRFMAELERSREKVLALEVFEPEFENAFNKRIERIQSPTTASTPNVEPKPETKPLPQKSHFLRWSLISAVVLVFVFILVLVLKPYLPQKKSPFYVYMKNLNEEDFLLWTQVLENIKAFAQNNRFKFNPNTIRLSQNEHKIFAEIILGDLMPALASLEKLKGCLHDKFSITFSQSYSPEGKRQVSKLVIVLDKNPQS